METYRQTARMRAQARRERLETRRCLDEFRGFRHIVRNVYTTQLRPSRMQELVAELGNCQELLARDLTEFARLLEGVGNIPG